MRRLLIVMILSGINLAAMAQLNPVHWHFSSKQIADLTYELHFMARIDPPWHIYSQDNSEDAAMPTSIQINPNPSVEISGKPTETGSLKTDSVAGTIIRYYENDVDFVQIVKLKTNAKTRISGKIAWTACTERCLPEAEQPFNITIGGN